MAGKATSGRARFVALAVVLTATAVSGTSLGATPVGAATGSTTCTEAGVTWQVDWTHDTPYGGVVKVAALKRNGVADTGTWQLRWDNPPELWAPATPPASVVPFQQLQGTLSALQNHWVSVFLSPRLVVPDGSCSVYLAPFVNLQGETAGPKIGVLGDDLVQQLNDSTYNVNARHGYLEGTLNALSVRVEAEGQAGRRLTPTAGLAGQAKADSYLLDELRGLLESDTQGFVVAAGINDAIYIAAGADQAARNARRDEVYSALGPVLQEINSRSACTAMVTVPEGASSLDPDYQWAALQVNNFLRFVSALGPSPSTDAGELIDFGAQAATHGVGSAEPWFGPDGVHLAGAGIDAYTDVVTKAAQRCSDSVVLWGAPGTLDDGRLAGEQSLPSGQAYNVHEVPGFDYGAGKAAHFSTMAADGTIFYMTGGSAGNVFIAGGEGMTISGFNPDAGTFETIGIKSDRNVDVPQLFCREAAWAWCQDDGIYDLGGWLGDVQALPATNGGNAVAFTGYQPYMGQNLEACEQPAACGTMPAQGMFPIFGVVTKGADGTWGLQEGSDGNGDGLPDWRNAWSGRELYDATVAADPENGAALADQLCPLGYQDTQGTRFGAWDVQDTATRDCGFWVNEIAVLPQSHDVVVAHYGSGKLGVIHLEGPDPSGRLTAQITAVFSLPMLPNPTFDPEEPEGPGNPRLLPAAAPREVQADPSSPLGDERFGLGMDFAPGLIELSYDRNAATLEERLRAVSAPVLSGELHVPNQYAPVPTFVGYGSFTYDRNGNLWVPTDDANRGLGMKVYTRTADGRRLTRPECLETVNGQPKPLADYLATDPTSPETPPTWGKVCAPDYNILQARTLGAIYGVEEDPTTGNIALTSWVNGTTTVVDADDPGADGLDLTFKVGNIANPLTTLTGGRPVTGPCYNDRTETCTQSSVLGQMAGPIDPTGRLWIAAQQFAPGASHVLDGAIPEEACNRDPETHLCLADDPNTLEGDAPSLMLEDLDQWAYSIDLSKLLGREARQLTVRPGQTTTLHPNVMTTNATTRRPGTIALEDVDSLTPVRGCLHRTTSILPVPCIDPVTGVTAPIFGMEMGAGVYELGDETDADANGYEAVPAGSTYEYRVTVPKAGSYDVTLRASTRDPAAAKDLVLTFSGGGLAAPLTRTVPITSQGPPPHSAMRDHAVTGSITLPAGTYTMQVAAPQGGWELGWMTFTRT